VGGSTIQNKEKSVCTYTNKYNQLGHGQLQSKLLILMWFWWSQSNLYLMVNRTDKRPNFKGWTPIVYNLEQRVWIWIRKTY
jgi:hypothetical protein